MNYTFIIFVYILFHNKMQLQSYEKDYFIILHMFFFYICSKDGIFLQMKKRMEQVL